MGAELLNQNRHRHRHPTSTTPPPPPPLPGHHHLPGPAAPPPPPPSSAWQTSASPATHSGHAPLHVADRETIVRPTTASHAEQAPFLPSHLNKEREEVFTPSSFYQQVTEHIDKLLSQPRPAYNTSSASSAEPDDSD